VGNVGVEVVLLKVGDGSGGSNMVIRGLEAGSDGFRLIVWRNRRRRHCGRYCVSEGLSGQSEREEACCMKWKWTVAILENVLQQSMQAFNQWNRQLN
jgi:hypothetical protein